MIKVDFSTYFRVTKFVSLLGCLEIGVKLVRVAGSRNYAKVEGSFSDPLIARPEYNPSLRRRDHKQGHTGCPLHFLAGNVQYFSPVDPRGPPKTMLGVPP